MLEKIFYVMREKLQPIRDFAPRGRRLQVFDDDVFIVSYPKSGNTWCRFLLGNLLSQAEDVTFSNLEEKIPDIYQNADRDLKRLQRPRILKSHEYLDPRYKKLVYIVRDPRDVVVSYYHFLIKVRMIVEDYPISEFVKEFIDGNVDPFGSWGDHVGGWIGARQCGDTFLLLRYEDMLSDTCSELEKIASFLNMHATTERLERAVGSSKFEKMQRLERGTSNTWRSIKNSRSDKGFVRSGKSGQWKSELPKTSVAQIEDKWPELLQKLGYTKADE